MFKKDENPAKKKAERGNEKKRDRMMNQRGRGIS